MEDHARAYLAPGLAGESTLPDVVQRFLIAVAEGKVPNDRDRAAGYFRRAVRNSSIDEYRRIQRLRYEAPAVSEVPDPDDPILRLLDPEADRARVAAGLHWCRSADDQTAIRVVRTWLNLAKVHSVEPSNQTVADEVGISHEAVRKALERFRRRIAPAP
jgi:DNA-directed RNA polymerase specialized sigma24 family protein